MGWISAWGEQILAHDMRRMPWAGDTIAAQPKAQVRTLCANRSPWMKLLLKFNLIFVLAMAVGVAVSGWISRSLLQARRSKRC
jgi:hypothetical protein